MTEFIDDDVTVSEQFNVKVEVAERLTVDEYLWDVCRQRTYPDTHTEKLK